MCPRVQRRWLIQSYCGIGKDDGGSVGGPHGVWLASQMDVIFWRVVAPMGAAGVREGCKSKRKRSHTAEGTCHVLPNIVFRVLSSRWFGCMRVKSSGSPIIRSRCNGVTGLPLSIIWASQVLGLILPRRVLAVSLFPSVPSSWVHLRVGGCWTTLCCGSRGCETVKQALCL